MIGPDFWQMGGYAVYVWPAYSVSLVALLALGLFSFRKMKALEKRLSELKPKPEK